MAAARTVVVSADGGRISSTQSIGPGAALRIRSESSSSLPLSFTGRSRSPNRRARSSSTASFSSRRDDASRAHREGDRDGGAAEIAGGAADQNRFSRLQLGGKKTAIGHEQRSQRAPLHRIRLSNRSDRLDVLGRNQHLLGP